MSDRLQNSTYWVIFSLAIAAFPQVLSMPIYLSILMLAACIWRIGSETSGWRPPGRLVRLIAIFLALVLLFLTHGELLGRRAAVSLLTVMMALKLLEMNKLRDARIIVSLCFFLCGTQFLFQQGIIMMLYGGAIVIVGLISLNLLHRKEAFQPVRHTPGHAGSIFSDLGFYLRLVAISIPIAAVVFLLFPRWSSPLWGVPEQTLDAKTGLSDSMSPGSIQGLFMDDSPAFRAKFEQRIPDQSELYWRGPIFWEFDGREWRNLPYASGLRAEKVPTEGKNNFRYTIQLEPHERRWLFTLDYPAIFPAKARLGMDYQMTSRRSITSLYSYEVISNPDHVDSPELRSAFRSAALKLPPDFNPRTLELMRSWREETPDDRELVARALQYFNQQEFRYTLNPPLLSRHTVDEFIFTTRAGFCEHYASAFTIMMRMAGIPARVATGYQGGWRDDSDNYLLIRQSDAHAWSEIWLEGTGWRRVDPTAAVAPERVDSGALDAFNAPRHALDFAWMRGLRNGLDLFQRRWNDWIVAFNSDSQNQLFKKFGIERVSQKQLVIVLVVFFTALSLLTLPLLLKIGLPGSQDPVKRSWNIFRNRLGKAGIPTFPGQSPTELARTAGSQLSQWRAEIDRIVSMYIQLRYGLAGPAQTEFRHAVRKFRPHKTKTRE